MKPSHDFTMEQHLIQQYLARIGYASSPDHQSVEPQPNARSDLKPATAEKLLLKVLDQSKEQYAAQQQQKQQVPAANISSRPTAPNRVPELCNDPSLLIDTSFTSPSPGTEARHEAFEPRHEHGSRSSHLAPSRPIGAETPASRHSELERRRKTCLKIERQLEAARKELRTYTFKQYRINKEHEERIAELMGPLYDEEDDGSDPEIRMRDLTAEEAEAEEMRDIYSQYDQESKGAPDPETVDALFTIIADTEGQIMDAEEANMAAKRREVELEGKLEEAGWVVVRDDGVGEDGGRW